MYPRFEGDIFSSRVTAPDKFVQTQLLSRQPAMSAAEMKQRRRKHSVQMQLGEISASVIGARSKPDEPGVLIADSVIDGSAHLAMSFLLASPSVMTSRVDILRARPVSYGLTERKGSSQPK